MPILEQYVLGKHPNPALCEDFLVITPHFYAVIDGVTSKSDRLFDGKYGGRYAAELLADAVRTLDPLVTAAEAFAQLNNTLATINSRPDFAPHDRIQACAILYSKARREIWNYGDCSLMINNYEILHKKKIDDLLASLRSFTILSYLKQGGKEEDLLSHDIGREAILPFLKTQPLFANTDGAFGYPVLDGTGIRESFLQCYPVQTGDRIILASDGYPKLFDTLADSEAYLQAILERDPLMIYENKQTKLRGNDMCSYDDRAYLRFEVE